MSTPTSRVHGALTGDAALVAVVSTRVYHGALVQECALPAVVYALTGGDREGTLRGDGGLGHPRVQVDVYAETVQQAQEVHALVRTAMDALYATGDEPIEIWDTEPERYRLTADYVFPHHDSD